MSFTTCEGGAAASVTNGSPVSKRRRTGYEKSHKTRVFSLPRGRPKGSLDNTSDNPWPCICGKEYATYKSRQAHRRTVAILGTDKCGDAFIIGGEHVRAISIMNPVRVVMKFNGNGFICACNKKFKSESGLYGHRFKNKTKCNATEEQEAEAELCHPGRNILSK